MRPLSEHDFYDLVHTSLRTKVKGDRLGQWVGLMTDEILGFISVSVNSSLVIKLCDGETIVYNK